MDSYPNIEAFYSENEARLRSGEADYGVWWHDGVGCEFWRVSYVQATGEIYAVKYHACWCPHGQVEVLGIVEPDPEGSYYQTLDRILEGWSEYCGRLKSLPWIREKLAPFKKGGTEMTIYHRAYAARFIAADFPPSYTYDITKIDPKTFTPPERIFAERWVSEFGGEPMIATHLADWIQQVADSQTGKVV